MARKKTSKPLSVAVTGASGFLASRLIEKLCADERVASVSGFDVRPPDFAHPKFVFDELDVRDAALETRFQGIDTVVHLAFIMDPIRDEARMRDVNVNGSQNVFRCAAKAAVEHVVYTSSAVVYGAHPDNKIPLDEEAPLRANLDFSYAAHKLEVEYVIREVLDDYPKLALTVFRPAIVFGPHVDNAWSHSLELPLLFGIQGHAPPLQFVHEEDVADALAFAVFERIPGPYNLAAPGWLEVEEMLEISGRRKVDLPEPVAFALVERLWSLGLAEAPAGMLHYVMHPWVVSPDKLSAAGFTPRYSNRDAFAAGAEVSKDQVRLGRKRVKRRDLKAGAGAVGLIGAAVAAITLRRRSARA
ncbi:MAG: NAD-dependent epimerase/dehydratase family protein [Actinomycetota bacterium]